MAGDRVPTIADIWAAAQRIAPFVRRTPVASSAEIDALCGARVLLKCEHLQHAGAFKYRGATNAVQSLTDAEAVHGVATHSSGNHGQALALAAQTRGIPCHVVMPHDSTRIKLDAVRANGATISLCESTMAAREAGLARVLADDGASAVHPFSDPRVIAGQGTAVRELLADHPDIDLVLTPVGGGGLICGSAIAAHAHNAGIQIVGAEPEGARDAYDSLRRGERVTRHTPDTICDGLRGTIGAINFAVMREHDVDILLVSDAEVIDAMHRVRNALNLVIEPSSATVIAALARYPGHFQGRIVGVVLSGGNVESGIPQGMSNP
jgi:threonine dehydratase